MTAQVYIQLMDVKNVLIIPLAALGEPVGGNRYKVALLRNGEKREREVVIGERNDTDVEVVKGLEAGGEVIIGESRPSDAMTALLELRNVSRSYPSGEEQVAVLKDISCKSTPGRWWRSSAFPVLENQR